MRATFLPFIIVVSLSASLQAKEHKVGQSGKQFSEKTLKVKKGDTVIFMNDDKVSHNVFSTDAANKFNLKITKPGKEAKHTFNKAGEVTVRCAIHPKMKLKVIVEE